MTSRVAIALALLIAASSGISGASAEDFYKNKQLRLIAGFPAGNDYDLGARLLVRRYRRALHADAVHRGTVPLPAGKRTAP